MDLKETFAQIFGPGGARSSVAAAQVGMPAVAKRVLDIAVAGTGLIAAMPVIAATAIAVRSSMGSPVVFRQVRPGKGGVPFELVKFRTMRDARDANGNLLSDDERLTAIGKWIRASSLDELPQLWNVLKGDMSLVGPRPLLMQYLERYSPRQSKRHDAMPGITGWSQINGRNAIDWGTKLEQDVWYVENWSLLLDLKILALTALKVVKRDGISKDGHVTMPEFMGASAKDSPVER